MATGFVAVFGALSGAAQTGVRNDRRTQAASGIQSWAEGLQQPAYELTGQPSDRYKYTPCANPAGFGTGDMPSGALPNSWVLTVKKVQVLSGFTSDPVPEPIWLDIANPAATDACNAGNRDKGVQRVTLQVETPAGTSPKVTETLVVTRRNARCPVAVDINGVPSFNNADLGPC